MNRRDGEKGREVEREREKNREREREREKYFYWPLIQSPNVRDQPK